MDRINSLLYATIIDQLIEEGVGQVVLSPGSRSTPLAALFYAREEVSCYMQIDERSAAFFALGMSKASRRPTVLICTSGSAGANYFPAIVEANLARTPLIVMTADRPESLQDCGAAQTMNQENLFGTHVKAYYQLPSQISQEEEVGVYRQKMRELYAISKENEGVVHINVPIINEVVPIIEKSLYAEYPIVAKEVESNLNELDASKLTLLVNYLQNQRVWVMMGMEEGANYSLELVAFCEKYRLPLFADPLSNLRSRESEVIVRCYDSWLNEVEKITPPSLILRFGAFPISKRWMNYIQHHQIPQIIIDHLRCHRNPLKNTLWSWVASPALVLSQLIKESILFKESDLALLQEKEREYQRRLKRVERLPITFEGHAVRVALDSSFSHFFVANSMSIRYMDSFFYQASNATLYANRGVNGIDGIFSTALGVATIQAQRYQPLLLITGDLSFIHDVNAMLLAKTQNLSLTVLLFNNHGGGIFNFLPQKNMKDFTYLFTTPQEIDVEKIVTGYGHWYRKIEHKNDLKNSLERCFKNPGVQVLELETSAESVLWSQKVLEALW